MAVTPGACPPGSATYDVGSVIDCVAQVAMLYQAYIAAVSGQHRVIVRFNERWSEYTKPNAPALLALYQSLYAQCPGAAQAGLPDLNPNLRVQRGRPARGFFRWPHL